MGKKEITPTYAPSLFNVFHLPEVKSVRASSNLRAKVDLEKVLERAPRTSRRRASDKDVAKFELERGMNLLLFPSGRIEIRAPDEVGVRMVLEEFRNELYECGLIGEMKMRCMEEGCDEEGSVSVTSLEKGGDGWKEVTRYYCEEHAREK